MFILFVLNFCRVCWSKPLNLEQTVVAVSFLLTPSKARFLQNLSKFTFPVFLPFLSLGGLARSSLSIGKLTGLILVLGVCLSTQFVDDLSDFRQSGLGVLPSSIFWDADSTSWSRSNCALSLRHASHFSNAFCLRSNSSNDVARSKILLSLSEVWISSFEGKIVTSWNVQGLFLLVITEALENSLDQPEVKKHL